MTGLFPDGRWADPLTCAECGELSRRLARASRRAYLAAGWHSFGSPSRNAILDSRCEADGLLADVADRHALLIADEVPATESADFDLAPGSSKPCHSPASHGYCGYNPPAVRCGDPEHHDHLSATEAAS